jgi:uncharacterized protein (DUF2147 family)
MAANFKEAAVQKPFKMLLTTVLALALSAGPLLAADFDPRGRWQTTTGESRYDFAYCGDGSKLCATLVWLNADSMKSPARKQLGTHAVNQAVRTAANTWRGPLTYNGLSTTATLTLSDPKHLTISGCYIVWCKAFELVKISK